MIGQFQIDIPVDATFQVDDYTFTRNIDVKTLKILKSKSKDCTIDASRVSIDDTILENIKRTIDNSSFNLILNGIDVRFSHLMVLSEGDQIIPFADDSHTLTVCIDIINKCKGGQIQLNDKDVRQTSNSLVFYNDFTNNITKVENGYRLSLIYYIDNNPKKNSLLRKIPRYQIDGCKDIASKLKGKGISKLGFVVNHRYSSSIVTEKDLKGVDSLGYGVLHFASHNVEIVKIYRHSQGFCCEQIHKFMPQNLSFEDKPLFVKKFEEFLPPKIDDSLQALDKNFLMGNVLFVASAPLPTVGHTWAIIATF